jgi:hypothetical protein
MPLKPLHQPHLYFWHLALTLVFSPIRVHLQGTLPSLRQAKDARSKRQITSAPYGVRQADRMYRPSVQTPFRRGLHMCMMYTRQERRSQERRRRRRREGTGVRRIPELDRLVQLSLPVSSAPAIVGGERTEHVMSSRGFSWRQSMP